jgi:hypothetical protein
MAQIDSSIPMSFRSVQIESPINQMAAIAQLRGAQEASQMNALKLQEYQQQQQERNALSRIMSEPGVDFGSDAFMNRVLSEAPSMYEGIATRAAQRENLLAQREAREAQTQERKQKLSKEQLQSSLAELASYTTVDDARNALEQKVTAGMLTREQADKYGMGLPATDEEMPAWQLRTMRSLLTPAEVLQDVRAEKKDLREAERLKLEDDRVRETQRHAIAMEEIGRAGVNRAELQAAETARHNKAMEALRQREINKPRAEDNPAKVAHTSTDDQGNVTFYNAFGQVIRKETNAGKRSPNVIKAEQAQKNLSRDIERTTNELAEITKDGGLIDQSTGSYAGKAIDVGARIFGKATSGDIAAGKLAPISDMVLKMVPRFEGPQSDKDTKSYKEAAGQLADTTLPREIRKAAGKEILRLMKERKKEFGVEGMEVVPDAPDPLGIR